MIPSVLRPRLSLTSPKPSYSRILLPSPTNFFSSTSSSFTAVVPLHKHIIPTNNLHHDKTPIIFIHGLLGSCTNFRALQQLAAHTRPTVAVDLRNHGASPHTAGGMTFEQLAEDIAHVIHDTLHTLPSHYPSYFHHHHEKITKVDIIGHSLGGKTAMTLQYLYPDLIRKNIVVDISPVTYDTSDPQWKNVAGIVEAVYKLNPQLYKNRQDIDKELAKSVPDIGVRSFVAQNLVPQKDGSYKWRINTEAILQSIRTFATFPTKQELQIKYQQKQSSNNTTISTASHTHKQNEMWFIAGEKSTYLQPHHYPVVHDYFSNAKFRVIRGAGHWVHADKPQLFWDTIKEILHLEASWKK